MLQENVPVQRRTIKSFLAELTTYVSLLTPLLGALIAWRGLGETNYFFFFYAGLLLVVGIIWLGSQYRLAKNKIKREGVVQRPAWLWKLITNKIPHKSEQLLDSQVMVFVPPTKEAHAVRLDEEYNSDGNHILLFHCPLHRGSKRFLKRIYPVIWLALKRNKPVSGWRVDEE